MSTQAKEASDQRIFRGTDRHKGRYLSITPENSAMKHLVYGRIILDKEVPSAVFATGDFESGLICLSGQCTINADGQTFELDRYDSIYLPRETDVEVTTASAVDLVECSAAVERNIRCSWCVTLMWKRTRRSSSRPADPQLLAPSTSR